MSRSAAELVRFDGRVAVVTGAGRGLGREYALALGARGASVVVNDLGTTRSGEIGAESPADEVAEIIAANGGQAIVSNHDVSVEAQAEALIALARSAFDRVDIVINNAGISRGGLIGDLSMEAFRAVWDTHVMGSVHVTRAAWPTMTAQSYGRVVMTTSAVGLWGSPASTPYATAKAGIVGLARSLAAEGAHMGIIVNCVAPAAQTRLSADRFPRAGSRTWRPELVAPAVLYLAHESCAISGEIVSAFSGHFSRVQIVQGLGRRLDPRKEVEVEDFVDHVDEILSMEGARAFANGHFDALGTPLGVDLQRAVGALAPTVEDETGCDAQS